MSHSNILFQLEILELVRRQTYPGAGEPVHLSTAHADGAIEPAAEGSETHPHSTDNAAQAGHNVATFNAELYRRAVAREAELLDKLRALKVEVNISILFFLKHTLIPKTRVYTLY